jgi:iron(III) transport system permease protein
MGTMPDLREGRRWLRIPAAWRWRWGQPATVIGLAILPCLLILALYPFLAAVRESLGTPASLAYWQALLAGKATAALPFWTFQFAADYLWTPLWHSLVVAGASTLLACGLGGLLGCLCAVTDLRFKRILGAVALFHLILPPFALAAAWVSLAAAARLPDAWTFGPRPMILVLTLHFSALAYLFLRSAGQNLDASLIEAGRVHGAAGRQLMRRIVLPLLRPAWLAAAGLIFFSALAAFAPMRLLGGGRHPYYVLATQVYSLYTGSLGDPRVGVLATVLALVLALVALPPMLLFLGLLSQQRRYSSVGPRGHRPWVLGLGRWRDPLSALCLLAVSLGTLGPLVVLGLQSLSSGQTGLGLAGLTLDNYRALLAGGLPLQGLAGSLLLALAVATLGLILGLLAAYSLQRSPVAMLRRGLYVLLFLPFVLPGVALGLIYYVQVSGTYRVLGVQFSPRFLYGSLALAVTIATVRYLPLAAQAGASTLVQLDPALEEAAYVFRASFVATLRRVLLPLVRGGAVLAWLLLFIFAFKEIDVLAFVYPPLAYSGASWNLPGILRAPPVMYQVFDLVNDGSDPGQYARGVALLLVAVAVLTAVTVLVARLGTHKEGGVWSTKARR